MHRLWPARRPQGAHLCRAMLWTSRAYKSPPHSHMAEATRTSSADAELARDGMLRQALVRRLCCPERPLPLQHVYQTICNPCRLVQELHCSKPSRRLAKQHAALRFLRRHNVLMHGLLFFVPESSTWNVTSEFARLALFGESILRLEVTARVAKLLPDIGHELYDTLLHSLLSESAFSRLFDTLCMEQIVGARPPPPPSLATRNEGGHKDGGAASAQYDACDEATALARRRRMQRRAYKKATRLTPSQKSYMLCALVGEMQWFVDRTRATDRTSNNALFPPSDVLVLHVLCVHLLECLPAELIMRRVEPQLESIRAVWVNEPMSLPSQLHLRPRTIASLSLSLKPHSAAPPGVAEGETSRSLGASTCAVENRLAGVRSLTRQPELHSVLSLMRPRCNYKHFDSALYTVLPPERRAAVPHLTTTCTFSSSVSRHNDDASSEKESGFTDARRRELVAAALSVTSRRQ